MSYEQAIAEVQSLQPSAIITLFVLDATPAGGEVLYLFPDTSPTQTPLVWQGQAYTPFPIEIRGYELKGEGAPPRPTLFVGNVAGGISALCLAFDDLIGTRVTRRRTFARFLDGQPDAANIALPDDVFFIERKVSENRQQVEFELSTRMVVDGLALPKRRVLANLCQWDYRGEGCQYAGGARSNVDDVLFSPIVDKGAWSGATAYVVGDAVSHEGRWFWCHTGHTNHEPPDATYWRPDECSKRVNACQLRFPGTLPFGAFPSVQRG